MGMPADPRARCQRSGVSETFMPSIPSQVRYQALLEVQRMEGDNRRREEARLRQQQEDAERERRQRELERKLVALALARDMVKGRPRSNAVI